MMRIVIVFLTAVLWGCSSVSPVSTASYPRPTALPTSTTVGVEVVFSDDEIKIIRAYYATNDAASGQGKHKHKHKGLPPGIAKNLKRGKPLPPGIAKQTLPPDLQRQLPAPPHGYERIIVDGKLLLVELGTQIVHDVLMDIVFG
jgi:Ni/Co efflux regulator RcnB